MTAPAARLLLALVALGTLVTGAHAQTPSTPPSTPPPTRCTPADRALIDAPSVVRYGLTAAALQSDFFGKTSVAGDGSFNDAGYRPVRLTGYVAGGAVQYATKWVKDNGPGWTARYGLTSAQFHKRFLQLRSQGYMIIDASGYNTPSGTRYADIWVKNTKGLNWAVTRDVPAAQMAALKLAMRADGLAPTHTEGYASPTQTPYFITTWVQSSCDWVMEEELTGAQYQAFFNLHQATRRPLHVDGYMSGSQVRFASIFWTQPGPTFRASHGQHWYLFQASFNQAACDGFTLDSLYGMDLPDGWQAFGGVWSFRGTPAVNAASPLATRVAYHVDCAPGRAGAALINVTTGQSVFAHADQRFGTASASKGWILYALLRKADAEHIELDATFYKGTMLTTLATQMIVDSNNDSTNDLIDYVGMDVVNDELAALGLGVSRLQRYFTGGPSAHGLASWFDDFKAGWDNFTTPRELATFWQLVYQNEGLLSADAHGRFQAITGAAPTTANDALDGGYDPASVIYFNKAGSKTYTGLPGDFAHRPQLGTHAVNSEGGVMAFADGDLVFYAVLVDQRDPALPLTAIQCVGWEAATEWGGVNPGDSGGQCVYP